ncbi:MAG: ATP-binding cassette domain-containing protein [Lachnospiraceae bacterium]|nr:ATP-binding cassette domain-containing protein [Lachnospiraceae bacterium]
MELTIQNISKKYGNKIALKDFSYTFRQGIYGILGANGAGKSTLLGLITDNIRRDEGRILLNGEDILRQGKAFRRLLGFMPQQQGLYEGMTVTGFLAYMARLKEIPGGKVREEINRVLSLSNLSDAAHKKCYALSSGMRQRLLLAQALLGDPKILILDEPTAGLDPRERGRLRDHIAQLAQDRIVLLATHIVSDIEAIADDVLLMREGGIIRSGPPDDLIKSLPPEVLSPDKQPDLEDVYLYYLGGDPDV